MKENGEFENMEEVMGMPDVVPSLQGIVDCAWKNLCCGVDERTL